MLINLDAWLHIVAWEKASDAVHDALPPAIVVLLQHIQHRTLLEAQFIVFISVIIIDCHHWKQTKIKLLAYRKCISTEPTFFNIILGHPSRQILIVWHDWSHWSLRLCAWPSEILIAIVIGWRRRRRQWWWLRTRSEDLMIIAMIAGAMIAPQGVHANVAVIRHFVRYSQWWWRCCFNWKKN